MYQPHRLHHSRLVLLLQQWTQEQTAQVRVDVAEQLSQWLSTVDAVQLSRALHALESTAPAATPQGSGGMDVWTLEATVAAAQRELTELVMARPAPARPSRARADNTVAERPDPQIQADFALHAARYLTLQNQFDARLAAVRSQLRQRLSAGPVPLRRLAALDVVMEQMLGLREQKLWASLPSHLERRMAQLRTAHRQRLEAAGEEDDPKCWGEPGGWLANFEQDLRALLLAELHVRMQPLTGLVEAAQGQAQLAEFPPRGADAPRGIWMSEPQTAEQVTGTIE